MADVWEGSMLGVHTIVKVIGLTSPAAIRGDKDTVYQNQGYGISNIIPRVHS